MTVDNDIQNAIRVLYGEEGNTYRKIRIFPKHSLKHFKKYKLDNKKVLSRVNSLDEILDLLSYNAKVTCLSSNKLDEYFLNLLVVMHNIGRKKYMDFIFDDYGHEKAFSKKYYDMIKDEIDDKTRYFFDEIYRYCNNSNIQFTKLIEKQKYPKEVYDMYVKNYLLGNYNDILNNKLKYLHINDDIIYEDAFDVINLSYDINDLSNMALLLKKIEKYKKLLNENGKMQSFTSFKDININKHKQISTRSILDPYTDNENCKKEYAYMYRKSQ